MRAAARSAATWPPCAPSSPHEPTIARAARRRRAGGRGRRRRLVPATLERGTECRRDLAVGHELPAAARRHAGHGVAARAAVAAQLLGDMVSTVPTRDAHARPLLP